MHVIDLLVVALYVAAVLWLGARFARAQQSPRDYFLTSDRVPWWALLGSIVATETSTVTLISVPGYAFGGDLTFLQLALGYIIARVVVALVLVPVFWHRRVLTAYQILRTRFGAAAQRAAAALFLGTRSLSDGFRLFATGLVLAAVLDSVPVAVQTAAVLFPALEPTTALLVMSVVLLAATTLTYTMLGGMAAVIWTDVMQLVVYLGGTAVIAIILLQVIPGGWGEVVTSTRAAGKLRLLDFSLDITRSYTFWSGLVGGIFITAATHGADQMFVQRYLCGRSLRDAQRALVVSGLVIFVQFTLFLLVGLMLWVYYTEYAEGALAAMTVGGQLQTDRILPAFMMSHLPIGLKGLMIAAIVAAAMSTLSSSLNSSAASTVGDFSRARPTGPQAVDHDLGLVRWITAGWALVQATVALVAIRLSSRVVDEVLGIQSFTGGLVLGALALAVLTAAAGTLAALSGLAAGTTVLLAVRLGTDVSWQWYALIGSVTTVSVGVGVAWSRERVRRHGARP